MLTKAHIRFIQSLGLKKHRDAHRLFVAEGEKLVSELCTSLLPYALYTTNPQSPLHALRVSLIGEQEMQKISFLTQASPALGIFHQPQHEDTYSGASSWTLALDDVQDPGNVGTIIRLCDWFGVNTLLCSPHTADCYSPKVVQASMGAIAGVKISYGDLPALLKKASKPVWGACLEGQNIYKTAFPQSGVMVFGNEGKGISKAVAGCIGKKVCIPSVAAGSRSESLNVAIAAAVICSELQRNNQ
jgi:TrmH family RNA methyltransferase